MKQKEIFLENEGDAWFQRNQDGVVGRKLPEDDPVLLELLEFPPVDGDKKRKARILEIGCGEGVRLAWLQANLNMQSFGLDPSAQAVAAARARGVDARQGTADELPFAARDFDIVIFGFCLYLCDRDDLFSIAAEADRVLASPGWLIIMDFFSPIPRAREYHHKAGLFSYKMDYRTLFSWHPAYECLTHKVRLHGTTVYTDDREEWVSITVLRKNG